MARPIVLLCLTAVVCAAVARGHRQEVTRGDPLTQDAGGRMGGAALNHLRKPFSDRLDGRIDPFRHRRPHSRWQDRAHGRMHGLRRMGRPSSMLAGARRLPDRRTLEELQAELSRHHQQFFSRRGRQGHGHHGHHGFPGHRAASWPFHNGVGDPRVHLLSQARGGHRDLGNDLRGHGHMRGGHHARDRGHGVSHMSHHRRGFDLGPRYGAH